MSAETVPGGTPASLSGVSSFPLPEGTVNARSFEDIARFIFISDPPVPSDLILIPGTLYNAWALCRRAAELYHGGYAPYIFATGRFSQQFSSFAAQTEEIFRRHPDCEERTGPADPAECETEGSFLKRILLSLKVPGERILVEDGSFNTFENALNARQLLLREGIPHGSVLLCPKPFHSRRALMTFQSAFPASVFTVCPGDIPTLTVDNWFDTPQGYKNVLDELEKCGAYFNRPGMYEKAAPLRKDPS